MKEQSEGLRSFGFVFGIYKNCELAIEARHPEFRPSQKLLDCYAQSTALALFYVV